MANKKDGLQFMQMPLPQGRNSYKLTKINWSGLNKRQTIDTGVLSAESNISTDETPYLVPSQARVLYKDKYYNASPTADIQRTPISMFGFADFLIVIYREQNTNETYDRILIDYIKKNGTIYTGTLKAFENSINNMEDSDLVQRSIVQFNRYASDNPLIGSYVKKLLILPDKKSIDFVISANFTPANLDETLIPYTDNVSPYKPTIAIIPTLDITKYYYNTYTYLTYGYNGTAWVEMIAPSFPPLKYAVVHQSRLFGVSDSRIYASSTNSYTNWTYDTAEVQKETNAWATVAQSNTKSEGEFTGIALFQGQVIAFKKDYMHGITNNKTPFRVQDIYAEGTIDNRSIQDVDGQLIFVDTDNVKVFTGGNPHILSYNLNIGNITKAVSGTDNRKYYLYCQLNNDDTKHYLFVYDTISQQWSEESIDFEVLNFAYNSNNMYCLGEDGKIYRMKTSTCGSWYFETDLFTNKTIDIKSIRKIQMLSEVNTGSTINIHIVKDNETFGANSQKLYTYTNNTNTNKRIPIRLTPRQASNYCFKLHISGTGYVKLYQMELSVNKGGELYNGE
jgi:hypothetical protein